MSNTRPIGVWVMLIVGILLLIMLLVGQTMSYIDYEFTVSLGLQESVDVVGPMGVAVNKAFGIGDTIIYVPLLVVGLIGLWLGRTWSVYAMAGVFGITAYWPIVSLCILLCARGTPGFYFNSFCLYAVILVPIAFYGVWGLWYLLRFSELSRQMTKDHEPKQGR